MKLIESHIRRDRQETLPLQIAEHLRERIASREYAPGQRLANVRALAEHYGVCPVTVLKAMEKLVAEELLTRNGRRGFYVSRRVGMRARPLSCCFAFPERMLGKQFTPSENDCLQLEIYRGLLAGCVEHRVDLQFCHFPEEASQAALRLQANRLKAFDFVVFTGQQLSELQALSAEERPTFCIMNTLAYKSRPAKVIPIDYDRDGANRRLRDLLDGSGCASAAVLTSTSRCSEGRVLAFSHAAQELCLESPDSGRILAIPCNTRNLEARLCSFLRKLAGTFLFCDTTDFVLPVYQVAMGLGLKVGRDFQLAGIASGCGVLGGLLPQFTYLHVPFFQLGLQAVELASRLLRDGVEMVTPELLPVTLVRGETVHIPLTNSRQLASTSEGVC